MSRLRVLWDAAVSRWAGVPEKLEQNDAKWAVGMEIQSDATKACEPINKVMQQRHASDATK